MRQVLRELGRSAWEHRGAVPARVLLVAGAVVPTSQPVVAHGGFDTGLDAPIPPGLLYGGAVATLLATALLAADGGSTPDLERRLRSVPAPLAERLALLVRTAFLLAVTAALVDGLVGPRNYLLNGATLVVWPLLVEGVALWSILAGSPWRTLAPWRTVHDALSAVEGRELRLRSYPTRLGRWPALVGYVVLIGVVANLTRIPFDPPATAAVLAGYALVMLVGGVVFGRAWFEHADPLAVLYDLLGRASPLSIDRGPGGRRRLVARTPWTATARPVHGAVTAAFVVATVYTVSFDGFVDSPVYRDLYAGLREGLGPAASVPIYLVGLGAFLLVFALAARLTTRLAGATVGTDERGPAGDTDRSDGQFAGATALAGSLVPIAAGYEVAHNWSYVVTVIGHLPRSIEIGPFAPGRVELLGWIPLEAAWASQVALIVVGHAVAVVAAHAVTVRLAGPDATPRTVLRAHAPILLLMIGYTVLSLWVVSLPAG